MPLVRFPVRNEYALGHPDLYKEANKEDPKALLDGVAVAGLVGILRQLGDLAEFAAEVFHGLQEQVMTTAARSHKLMVRVQHIESALPPLEKAVLAQTSHIHFAYTAGSEWHPRIENEQNHFIYNDLPRFIMDSYEECRDPPRLHLLDKFDSGGPGSCLKRYSDPAFFKRVSGSSIEATTEKFQRDKKARKSKKKRSSQRNGEISRVASMSNHSGRLHLTSQAINGRTSSQTASTIDMTLKSDFGDHCNSFDSRTGSGYIECVFNLGSSSQPGEQESKGSASSLIQQTDTLDSVFGDESTQIVDNNFPCSSSQEQVAPSSSCVTWDEKTEIVEPKGQHCDRDEDLEVLSANFDMDSRDRGTTNLRNVDQMDILLADEDTSLYNANEFDEVESEPDNYMDALNTIESESENDLDCQTKREVEQFSCDFNNGRKEDGGHGPEEHKSDHYPSNIESHAESSVSSSNGMPSTLPNSFPSESNVHEPKPQISGKSSDSDHSASADVCASADSFDGSKIDSVVTDGSKAECVVNDPSSSGSGTCDLQDQLGDKTISGFSESQEPPSQFSGVQSFGSRISDLQDQLGDKTISSFSESQEPPSQFSGVESSGSRIPDLQDQLGDKTIGSFSESQQSPQFSGVQSSGSRVPDVQHQFGDKTISSFSESQQPPSQFSGVQSVQFWTNGSLLGLQPSKPPDFAVSNAKNQDNVSSSKCEIIGPPNPTLNCDVQKEKLGTLVETAENFEVVSSSNTRKIPLPLADSDATLEKCGGSQNSLNHGSGVGLNVGSVAASKTEPSPDVKAASTEANQGNDGNSSLVFGLGHRLLANGFRRKLSLVHDDQSEPGGSLVTGGLDQDSGHPFDAYRTMSNTTFLEQFGHGSPLDSLTSSPPLEHMKISFNPIDGLEASKLKLTFPDGSHCHESVKDMFASFQLVPAPSTPLHEYGSDSDDDTFCRSSPYMSDDCLSPQSESNSEQWESGESPGGSKDHELFDAFRRESSMGIVSSSLPVEGTAKNEMHFNRELQSIYLENGAEPRLSNVDLPSFDAVNSVLKVETKSSSDLKIFHNLENPSEPTPLPPPLPPVQWRVTKSLSDLVDDKQYAVSEAFKHESDLKLLGSTISKQPEPPPVHQLLQKKENIASKRESKQDEQKFISQREANQDANGKEMDEKEDFLHQIRTKSFSLRPTVTARPTFGSGPATNVKVTAILQKANAIRQAVGSDDGEDDDNWSDT